jgi:uncharacterized glyoxalase superfamily protein PhnB/AraC-like DNA-binding protein
MGGGPRPSPELAWAWRTMQNAGGAVRIADLAREAGCSHRHLIGRFREQVGATPKTAARVLRYTRAARLLDRGGLRQAEVATACGYADQAHMIREYARLPAQLPARAHKPRQGAIEPYRRVKFLQHNSRARGYGAAMTSTRQRIVTILVYADIAAAHNYLVETFGFSSGGINQHADGEVMHAEVALDGEVIWLHRVSADYGLRSTTELGAATGMLNVLVDDVDAHHARSVAAGARITFPPTDMPYGQREYGVTDTENRLWSFATPT